MPDFTPLQTAPGHKLRSDAAPSWDRLDRAIQDRYGWKLAITDSYRPYEIQEKIFRERYQTSYIQYAPGRVDKRSWNGQNWYRKPGTAAAAVPGTSNHGKGTAVDAGAIGGFGSTKYNQLASLAGEYGWNNNVGRQIAEPWHWEYFPENDKHKGASAPAEEDDMTPLEMLTAQFQISQNGQTRVISVKDALAAIISYGDLVAQTPARVWAHPLTHTVNGKPTPAGDFLRYEPAEHAQTRALLTDAITAAVTKIPGVDPAAVKAAVAEGVQAALSTIETTVTVKK